MNNWFKQFGNWLLRLFYWVLPAKYGIYTIISYPVVIIFCGFFISEEEAVIRISGMIFQLLGLVTVIYGFYGTQELFGTHSIVIIIKNWANKFPIFKEEKKLLQEKCLLL